MNYKILIAICLLFTGYFTKPMDFMRQHNKEACCVFGVAVSSYLLIKYIIPVCCDFFNRSITSLNKIIFVISKSRALSDFLKNYEDDNIKNIISEMQEHYKVRKARESNDSKVPKRSFIEFIMRYLQQNIKTHDVQQSIKNKKFIIAIIDFFLLHEKEMINLFKANKRDKDERLWTEIYSEFSWDNLSFSYYYHVGAVSKDDWLFGQLWAILLRSMCYCELEDLCKKIAQKDRELHLALLLNALKEDKQHLFKELLQNYDFRATIDDAIEKGPLSLLSYICCEALVSLQHSKKSKYKKYYDLFFDSSYNYPFDLDYTMHDLCEMSLSCWNKENKKRKEILTLLLQHNDVDVYKKNSKGQTPLMLAASCHAACNIADGHLGCGADLVNFLLDNGIDINREINNYSKKSFLYNLIKNDIKLDMLHFFNRYTQKEKRDLCNNILKHSHLIHAFYYNKCSSRYDVFQASFDHFLSICIENGVDFTQKNEEGKTLLETATHASQFYSFVCGFVINKKEYEYTVGKHHDIRTINDNAIKESVFVMHQRSWPVDSIEGYQNGSRRICQGIVDLLSRDRVTPVVSGRKACIINAVLFPAVIQDIKCVIMKNYWALAQQERHDLLYKKIDHTFNWQAFTTSVDEKKRTNKKTLVLEA